MFPFERFTDRAKRVIALAQQEAQRFNSEYFGTEHMLLGLIKEGQGVGANVLKNLGVDLARVRLEVEKQVKATPDMVGRAAASHAASQKGSGIRHRGGPQPQP